MTAALKLAKKELRTRTREHLAKVPPGVVVAQSSKAVATLLSLPQYQSAKRISVFLSMPDGEIQTTDIIRDALHQGKAVFVPYTYRTPNAELPSLMDMVRLQSLHDYEGLQPDRWGIPTPSKDSISHRESAIPPGQASADSQKGAEYGGLDLVVMPGMAFDAAMGRLGHGKGYYDVFLGRCEKHAIKSGGRMPFLVGLALNEQLLDDPVPTNESDWRLDSLITGDGMVLPLSFSPS